MLKPCQGVSASGDHEELTERLELINKLRRRAQLRLSGVSPVPIKMTWKQLSNELKLRKINVNEESVKEMVEALEAALEKESESRVYGAGYEFGRRHLSALNMIDAEEMTSAQLRAAIKARGTVRLREQGIVRCLWFLCRSALPKKEARATRLA